LWSRDFEGLVRYRLGSISLIKRFLSVEITIPEQELSVSICAGSNTLFQLVK